MTDRDDLPMVTPGGMILDLPKMVAATNVLTLFWRDDTAMCFRLVTFGRERQQCAISGVATLESQDVYSFRQQDLLLRLRLAGPDRIQVELTGDRYRQRCELVANTTVTYTR